jgi:predicted phage terminase large subunit-like protein
MFEQIRRTIGEYNFAGQYQQAPRHWAAVSSRRCGSGITRRLNCRRASTASCRAGTTANKATELSDFSVCTSWGIKGKDLYLLDVLRRRMEYPELKRSVREHQQRFRANVVLIEDKASGTQLIQELIREGLYAVTRYQPQSDKVMRMHAQTAVIENGFVRLPESAPWLAQYLQEMTVFPNGRHDDQVDSTAQLLDWFKEGGGPAPMRGSSNSTGSAPRSSAAGRRRALRCACAPRAASRMSSCFLASIAPWHPTARSK